MFAEKIFCFNLTDQIILIFYKIYFEYLNCHYSLLSNSRPCLMFIMSIDSYLISVYINTSPVNKEANTQRKRLCFWVVISGGSRISPRRGRQHKILPKFPKNCMKLKEFRSGVGVHPSCPPPQGSFTRYDVGL